MEYFLYAEKSRKFGKTSDLRLRFQIKISVQPQIYYAYSNGFRNIKRHPQDTIKQGSDSRSRTTLYYCVITIF